MSYSRPMSEISRAMSWIMNQLGYAICHQLPERSLHFGGKKLPVCARDTGLFLGFAVTTLVLLALYRLGRDRYPSVKVIIVLCLLILTTYVDAITAYLGLRQTSNAIRLGTGSLAGGAAAALVFPLFVRSVSKAVGERRVLEHWWSLSAVVVPPLLISLALMPDWAGAYWLWAPLVSLSILFTVVILNFTLLSLVIEWLRGDTRRIRAGAVWALAGLAGLVELVMSNRLHWLAQRFL